MEISTDNGTTFQHLPILPYGNNEGVDYPCVAIINETTVFIAGGRSEGWVRHRALKFMTTYRVTHLVDENLPLT